MDGVFGMAPQAATLTPSRRIVAQTLPVCVLDTAPLAALLPPSMGGVTGFAGTLSYMMPLTLFCRKAHYLFHRWRVCVAGFPLLLDGVLDTALLAYYEG